jgi:cell division septation protein DedD
MRENVPKKKKRSSKPSRSILQLTRKQFFVWFALTFFAMAWMFVLGILVGRGLSPVRFDVPKLKDDLVTLKEKVLPTEEKASEAEKGTTSEVPDLEFYKALRERRAVPRSKARIVHRKVPGPNSEVAETPTKPHAVVTKNAGFLAGSKLEDMAAQEDAPELEIIPKKLAVTKKPKHYGALTIQVAAFKRTEKAQELIAGLRRKGYDAYKVTADLPNKGTYHRVRVGHYANAEEARLAASKLREERLETIIVRSE